MPSPDGHSLEPTVAAASNRGEPTTPTAEKAEEPIPQTERHEPPSAQKPRRRRKWPWLVGLVAIVAAVVAGVPWVIQTLNTVSTDDAYVNGHVTMVAPRVSGQVLRVLVDDNNIVHKGDLLVELDPEPYHVQVNIAEAAVAVAKADLIAAQAAVRGNEGLVAQLVLQLGACHRKR